MHITLLTETNGFGSLQGPQKFPFFCSPAMLGGSYGAAGAVRASAAGGREAFLILELVQVHLLLPALKAAEGHFPPARCNEENLSD